MEILDRQVIKLRNIEVASVKVLWLNHLVEGNPSSMATLVQTEIILQKGQKMASLTKTTNYEDSPWSSQ